MHKYDSYSTSELRNLCRNLGVKKYDTKKRKKLLKSLKKRQKKQTILPFHELPTYTPSTGIFYDASGSVPQKTLDEIKSEFDSIFANYEGMK